MTDLPQPSTTRPVPGQLTMKAPRRGKPPRHLADLDLAGRVELAKELGLPGFRAKQLSTHYFTHHTDDPAQMSDLPKAGREELVAALLPRLLTPVHTISADEGATLKSLWRLHDGATVESVLMRYRRRATICISSQAGCGMNCPFCATGQAGLTRNMSAAEIVDQVVAANRMLAESGDLTAPADSGAELGDEAGDGTDEGGNPPSRGGHRVTNVVFMGMGEALANYKSAIGAIRRMVDPSPEGLGMSARGITMSSVGLVTGIDKLTQEGIPVTLALSLHAPDDELRDELVPINTRFKVDEAIDSAHRYYLATGRRVSIEYAMIKDINDQAWRADLLAKKLLARGKGWVHINPIPLNPTPGSKWTASRPGVEQQFVERLRAAGIPTTVRDTRGSDIDGACGQLAATSS
ncbi:23S rRNA (adenine(2503)-C(2))-methyltransferase RlmN [Janibacter cremeus]|uniref:Probable dual-specificity RNA methyltransferase RlmN n=1 Tax=Janibacter cremeus TaxID=1285192 RepID=A0A852VML4_9MICO|nr:23S rRNA (adenine(2503)-C(2))-methyltransferase RlmN [Janibacter cremeus]NYF97169.1 23S rRNA (adenine2503-C2)-methyltransferase [Janibacter cremeus]